MSDVSDTDDRRAALDTFAKAGNNGSVVLAPGVRPLAGPSDRVFGAQNVAVYRDEARIFQKLAALGAAAGTEWFYRFPIRRKGGGQDFIEGASIKLANDVARIYGNCDVDVRVMDLGDTWLFYARFTDFETGYSLTRPFQQRKSQGSMKTDADRALDIAFQIGASKAIRNVVVNALQTFSDYAFDQARNSLVDKIGKDLPAWRNRTADGIAKMPCDLVRVETAIGKALKDWLAPDVAKVIAMMRAIADGMASVDETFPPIGAKAAAAEGETEETEDHEAKEAAADNANTSSPQAASTATAGPSAPASPEPSQEQKGPGAAETNKPAASDGKDVIPSTEPQYVAYANAWRDKLTDGDEGEKRWKAEKKIRNACNVAPEIRDDLEKKLKGRVAELRKG